jgi:hypothetical protein
MVLVGEFRDCLEGRIVKDEFLEDCVLIRLDFRLGEPLAQAELQDLKISKMIKLPHGGVSL